MTLLGKAEPRTGINTVEMNGRNKRPSKYKRIYPTTLKDLHEHHPEQHTRAELSESLLNSLSTGWRVKLVFIHRENLEVNIHRVDDEKDEVEGSVISRPTRLKGLQHLQLVRFKKECIVEVTGDEYSDSD